MSQKYDVYIGGRPLRFLDPMPLEQVGRDLPVVEVSGERELRQVVHELEHGAAFVGVQLLPVHGFDAWAAFQAEHTFVLAAGGLVRDETGRLLAIRRLGKWDLPKGKVEKNEAVDKAALREVKEECGLKNVSLVRNVTSTWHTYERKGKQHLKRTEWFLMQGTAQDVLVAQAEEDIEEVCWLDAQGLSIMERDTYPSLMPVLQAWRSING